MRTLFVFGSNKGGRHFGGAARYAHEKHGAKFGVAEGATGDSYALPTCDIACDPLELHEIKHYVERFKDYATASPDLHFYVTRVGCGIAGFTDEQIAPLFIGSPSNCTFDPQWSGYGLPAWKEVL